MNPEAVVEFWQAAGRARWYTADPAFDAQCQAFLPAHRAAARGDLAAWMETPRGALALVLLLDQFPRNLFRGRPRAYATDPLALSLAGRALERGAEASLPDDLRMFLVLPFMHSEILADQERCVALTGRLGDADNRAAAREHHALIARFGRFPHRNAILGRPSTAEEEAYLAGEGAFRG